MRDKPFAVEQKLRKETLFVTFSDRTVKTYDAIELGCQWLTMSDDYFYRLYGFIFDPRQYGLYERCQQIVLDGLKRGAK